MRSFAILLLLSLGLIAQAHSLDINRGVIELEADKAMVIITPPSSAFKAFDDNRDGLMSIEEVKQHREALNQFFSQLVKILSETGEMGQMYFHDIIVPGALEGGPPEGSNHLRFLRRYQWSQAPKQLTLSYGLFSDPQANLVTTVATGEKVQTAILSPAQPEYTFGQKIQAGLEQFLLMGLEHILIGYDHLLFLLALILAAGSLVQLLRIITAFTLAHSVTLALSVMGLVSVPPYLVEGVIALSIAYVALENLFRPDSKLHWRWLVVFTFGLVHGMGFAGALKEIGLPQSNLLASLLSFNLGVELGQIAFVLAVSALLALLRRAKSDMSLRRWGSVAVAGVALYWSVERFF